MTLPIFPSSLPGLLWGRTKSPIWSTGIHQAASGKEAATSYWSYPRWSFEVGYEFLRDNTVNTELATLMGFFNQCQGAAGYFLYSDPYDNSVTNQAIGTGDGSTTKFQLIRTMGGFIEPTPNINTLPVIQYNGQNANLVQNSSFEARTANQPDGYAEYNNGGISVTFTSPAGRTGGLAFGLKANASTYQDFGLLTNNYVATGGYTGGVAGGWQPGQTYTISFWAKKTSGTSWSNLRLGWNVSPDAVLTTSPPLTTSWQQSIFTFTWGGSAEPNGAIFISVNGNTLANDEINIDDLQVVIGPTALPYVAGEQSYIVDQNGIATFAFPPTGAAKITASFNFYFKCRFANDTIDFSNFMYQLWEAKKLPFVSVK